MIFLSLFLTSFTLGFSGAIMPGPVFTVTVNEAAKRGFMAGPLVVAGHAVLELALVAALLLGLRPLIRNDAVVASISMTGAAILLFMAVSMFRSVKTISLDLSLSGRKKSMHPVAAGLLTSAANPYWSVWWATIGAGYLIMASEHGMLGVASFYTGHILSDFTWFSLVSAMVSGGRRFFTDRIYRIITGGCAVGLVLLSVYFFVFGLRHLPALFR